MKLRCTVLAILAALAPSHAWANAGIPMLMLIWPLLGLAFVPVVGAESLLLSRAAGLGFRDTVRPVAVANAWSTAVGVPFTWLALLALEAVAGVTTAALPDQVSNSTTYRALLFPFFIAWIAGSSELEVKGAFVLLMLAFWAISAEVELRVLSRQLSRIQPRLLKRTVYTFNAVSYALLTALITIGFTLTS